jgi:membrane-associated phospholipid phosphatase
MPTAVRVVIVLLLLLSGGEGAGRAQSAEGAVPFCDDPARRTETLDTKGLGAVYCTTRPVFVRPLRWAHASAYPVFYGALPVAWGAALLQGDADFSDAYRLTLAQVTTYGLVYGLKRAVGRPRPYVRRALAARSSHHPAPGDRFTSFPSGHAAVSTAIATSWSLSHPRWYVIGPGAVWAAAVSLSRVHLGVHYPSDILVGTALGAGLAVLVHQLRGALTPTRLQADPASASSAPAPISIRIRF